MYKKILLSLIISTSLFSNDLDDFNDEFEQKTEVVKTNNDSVLYKYNVFVTDFNDKTYEYIVYPVSKAYKNTIKEDIRTGIDNVYENISFPQRFINNVLQLKFENSYIEFKRFVINTTLGFFGFKDVAKNVFELDEKKEDFGQTLGYYNVPRGYHIVLPILGPSNVRDIRGLTFDNLTSVKFEDNKNQIYSKVFENINKNSLNIEYYNNLKKDAIILQPYLENVYESYRLKLIKE